MKRFYMPINHNNRRHNIFDSKVLRVFIYMFIQVIFPFMEVNVNVYLRMQDSPILNNYYTKEKLILKFNLHYDEKYVSAHKFFENLKNVLHSYRQFKVHWRDIKYIVFEYTIIK